MNYLQRWRNIQKINMKYDVVAFESFVDEIDYIEGQIKGELNKMAEKGFELIKLDSMPKMNSKYGLMCNYVMIFEKVGEPEFGLEQDDYI